MVKVNSGFFKQELTFLRSLSFSEFYENISEKRQKIIDIMLYLKSVKTI